jgi:hypothetical protein
MPRPARLSAALLLAILTATAGAGETAVDLGGPVTPGRLDMLLTGVGQPGLLVEDRLAPRLERLHLHLRGADRAAVRQAAAHAAGAWWRPLPDGRTQLTRSPRFDAVPPLAVVTWLHPLATQRDAVAAFERVLIPWLDGQRGLAAHGSRLTALLDAEGRAQFDLLTRLLEGRQELWHAFQRPDLSPSPRRDSALALTGDWGTWLATAGEGLALSLAVDPLAAQRPPPHLLIHSRDELADGLRAAGIATTWRHGVLCLGGAGDDRLHPALRRRLQLVPAGHLPLEVQGPALVQRLAAVVPAERWQLPGWHLTWLSAQQAVLVAADDETIDAILSTAAAIDASTPTRDPPPAHR